MRGLTNGMLCLAWTISPIRCMCLLQAGGNGSNRTHSGTVTNAGNDDEAMMMMRHPKRGVFSCYRIPFHEPLPSFSSLFI